MIGGIQLCKKVMQISIIGTQRSVLKGANKNMKPTKSKNPKSSSVLRKYSSNFVIKEEKEDS